MRNDIVSDADYWTTRIDNALEDVASAQTKLYAAKYTELTFDEAFAIRTALEQIYAYNANLKSNVTRWKRLGKFKTAKAIIQADRWI